jgi:isochorismate pyruvate lyase
MNNSIDCNTLDDIRFNIDLIDEEIVKLIGERFNYVKAASKFKTSEATVKAPERFKSMLLQRREWASQAGLNTDVIENLFKELVGYFINEELSLFETNKTHE